MKRLVANRVGCVCGRRLIVGVEREGHVTFDLIASRTVGETYFDNVFLLRPIRKRIS